MNILFLGRFIPQKLLETVAENNRQKLGFSNHNFEMSIINGLCSQKGINVKCLSIPSVFSFPYNNKSLFTRAELYSYRGCEIDTAGFCNLPILKEIWSTIAITIRLIKNILKFEGKNVDIIINTPNNCLLSAVRIAQIFTNKSISKTVIIPDIPAMVTSMDKHNLIKRSLLNWLHAFSMKEISKCNGLVLLTEAMMDFVTKPISHIVMEGIVDEGTMLLSNSSNINDKEIILYTGTLRKIFGVLNLVEAFQHIEYPNAELWICGSGDSVSEIEAAARHDSRIKYWGLVDSATALQMQHQATILVNPRTSDGAYTKYSFPSKTMEYLLSGKSVIINRLPGIPSEYFKYVYTPNDESVEALSECIVRVLNIDPKEREMISSNGQQFIRTNKNSIVQTRRILEMISNY